MTLMFIISLVILSSIFFISNNPLSLGLTLIFQTIMVGLMLGNLSKSFWFFYILIMIFIGGMLILFIYVTSIFPNEKFSFSQTTMFKWIVTTTVLILLGFIYSKYFNISLNLVDAKISFKMTENLITSHSTKIMFSNMNSLIIFLVSYLFYCMIVVIKITSNSTGPIRMMNYV
uniref:NADH-ubiquinone oxidoreductase chain 6 n=1 Tax=Nepiomorpha sp. NespEL TaxID=1940904 RepID=A0A8K1ZG37_9NEOP|nr:NADH dehydrogenase subunit 6 [Nepiomorpha sp. NespEL]